VKTSVFGLGYVGTVAAACLANDGHEVVGVDPNPIKLDLISEGKAPLIEKDVGTLIEAAVRNGHLSATDQAQHAVLSTDLSIVCVGTPSQSNGDLDLRYVRAVCSEIGSALAHKTTYHVVVIRSTVLPGTMRDLVVPILEQASGRKVGPDIGLCHNPEFLREGTAVYDYYHPPKTVIGEIDSRSGDIVSSLYVNIEAPLLRVSVEVAEMVKYADNTWHAIKVCFANEIGNICKALGVDSHQVMDVFCQDTKLNLSAYYLRPGFAFGGSCLPKDVRAISYRARGLDLNLPLINAVLPSNSEQVERAMHLIQREGCKRIGVLGFSFKADTDDLRESPVVEVIERLLGKGYDLRLYDKNVNLARLTGSNKEFIDQQIPHISNLMVDSVAEILSHSELVIIGNRAPEFIDAIDAKAQGTRVLDLVRITEDFRKWSDYEGICW
jgi:GDP-mannose 6-dehydrogenase